MPKYKKKDKDGKVILYTNPHDDLYSISDWADLDDIEVDDLEVAHLKENDDGI